MYLPVKMVLPRTGMRRCRGGLSVEVAQGRRAGKLLRTISKEKNGEDEVRLFVRVKLRQLKDLALPFGVEQGSQ
jgi:hypothetical protein